MAVVRGLGEQQDRKQAVQCRSPREENELRVSSEFLERVARELERDHFRSFCLSSDADTFT